MEKIFLAASMMCANFQHLEREVQLLDRAGIDCYHIDIMDGCFVPNFGMGLQDLEMIRSTTKTMVDVHLMISNPSDYIDFFANKGVDIIYFHPESDLHPARTILKIKERGLQAGIAINPGTSVESIQELLPLVDVVLIMTVNPGFAGQKYLDFVNPKIEKLVSLKENYQYEIVVDGAISEEKIQQLSAKGVKGFVLGTSSLFNKPEDYETIVARLKNMQVAKDEDVLQEATSL